VLLGRNGTPQGGPRNDPCRIGCFADIESTNRRDAVKRCERHNWSDASLGLLGPYHGRDANRRRDDSATIAQLAIVVATVMKSSGFVPGDGRNLKVTWLPKANHQDWVLARPQWKRSRSGDTDQPKQVIAALPNRTAPVRCCSGGFGDRGLIGPGIAIMTAATWLAV